ncbi:MULTISPECIES: hypothetical protein [unclassified Ensifer]|uniref:hypothetical protein n=1 Tax=unclassified Ensifer TaxID=2633371 RepID=UPI0008132250|nr:MULTISPECIES: hypothetical protein [unclassified Ensifer]OCP23111.1 hypothetical protein BC361_23070 [Ensifer sp. LC54]OCP24939.1 hypothetical protein BC363_21250 [Ensifer sp. LC384]OCP38567.1 hypothetical protein BC360_00360 [Ensifer sp. LC163]
MGKYLREVAIAGLVVIIARYVLFRDADEFQRFYSALRTYVLPVGFANLALFAVMLVALTANKISPASQKRVANVLFWVGSTTMTAAFAWAIAAVKLSTAS